MSLPEKQEKSSEKDRRTGKVYAGATSVPSSPPLVAPDGGWGWVIIFANCLLTFVNSSIMYCFGVVYVYLVEIGYSNTEVAIVPALMNALSNLLAPISTALSRFYSHRLLAIVGNLLLAVGLFMCSFSNHIIWIYLSYGIIIGVGNALVHPQGFLLSQKYFHKKRVAANGLSMLGASIGFMTVPMILIYFIREYSYRAMFMLWSGLVLHGVIGGALFHPVEWHMKRSKEIPLQVIATGQTKEISSEIEEMECNSTAEEDGQVKEYSRNSLVNNETKDVKGTESELSSLAGDNEGNDSTFLERGTLEGRAELLERSNVRRKRTISSNSNVSSIFVTTDVMEGFGSALNVRIEEMKIEEEAKEKDSQKQARELPDHIQCGCITLPRFKDIFHFSLFKYPAFIISSFSSITNRMIYMCFVTYLPSIAMSMGLSQDESSYLFSSIAIFELLAKIVISLISDKGFMPRRYFLIIASVTSSISIFCLTFSSGFWTLAICCGCYGFSVGTQMCVGPILLIEYLGLSLLPYTYGLLLFMNGIAGLLAFAVTGILNDLAGDYLTTYWGLSIVALATAILWSSINCFPKKSPESILAQV